jgi:hypothetical protein
VTEQGQINQLRNEVRNIKTTQLRTDFAEWVAFFLGELTDLEAEYQAADTAHAAAGDPHTGYVLESAAVDLGCRLSTETDQTITAGVATYKTWASGDVVTDDGGFFDDTDDGFTIPTGMGGWYSIYCQGSWGGNTDQRRIMEIHVNGAAQATHVTGPTVSNTWAQQCSLIIKLAAADLVQMEVQTASAANIIMTSARFAIVRMGRFF